VILAFALIATNPRLFRAPLAIDEACAAIQGWLSQPTATDTGAHGSSLGNLERPAGRQSGAALAIEHGATLVTTASTACSC